MINLFIDAQIWLSLYSFSSNDLKQFGKIKECIANGEVNIILTEQIKDEVFRNRENKLHEVIDKTKNINFNIPVLYQGYSKEFSTFKKRLKDLQETNTDIQTKIEEDIIAQKLPQDILIKDLFELSTLLKTSQEILDNAILRFRILGNPPGKDNKCGDAINWETLLTKYDSGDLFFISDDKDYKSVLDKNRLNQYLENEWTTKKHSKIYFYENLNEFFSKHISDIKLTTYKKQDDLIKELAECGSFAETHRIIAKMAKYSDWNEQQISGICNIARYNNQVYGIIDDNDVHEFLERIISPLLFNTEDEDIIEIQKTIYKDDPIFKN